MTTRSLAWYLSAVFAVVIVFLSAMTVAPEGVAFFRTLRLITGVGFVGSVAIGIWLESLPAEHWVNRSRSINAALTVVAFLATALLLIG